MKIYHVLFVFYLIIIFLVSRHFKAKSDAYLKDEYKLEAFFNSRYFKPAPYKYFDEEGIRNRKISGNIQLFFILSLFTGLFCFSNC